MGGGGILLTGIALALATPLATIFVGYDVQLLDLTARGLRLYSISFLFVGFNIFASAFFTALNDGLVSALISFLRTLLFQTAAVLLLPAVLGVDGIWLAIVAAEVTALMVSLCFLVGKRGKYHYA